ncbi:MAG TPA: imidazole glycerol phosphate synthase subunit HisH, partial [Campylobacterales bacterium]|nr:imidazole glycerol phosphate synthase subunit HisH [Campylobacterales bacterium]
YLYFVHSYYVETTEENILATTQYGITFTSAIEKENIFGLQPHPEKSHNSGLKILKNFIEL